MEMNRRGGTGQVVDFIHFQIKGEAYIMPDQFKIRIVQKMNDVALGPGIEIIHAHNIAAFV